MITNVWRRIDSTQQSTSSYALLSHISMNPTCTREHVLNCLNLLRAHHLQSWNAYISPLVKITINNWNGKWWKYTLIICFYWYRWNSIAILFITKRIRNRRFYKWFSCISHIRFRIVIKYSCLFRSKKINDFLLKIGNDVIVKQ